MYSRERNESSTVLKMSGILISRSVTEYYILFRKWWLELLIGVIVLLSQIRLLSYSISYYNRQTLQYDESTCY